MRWASTSTSSVIHVDPASVSVVRYTPERPYVLTQNSQEGNLAWVVPPPVPDDDAAVGGGAGPTVPPTA